MGARRGLGILAAGVALAAAHATPASAHPLVDEGRARYEEAEFDAALSAFARAEQADGLTVADLADLFATRALVYLAMDNREAMNADLERLVSVAPDYELDRRVPPDVRRGFGDVRARSPGPIRLRASTESSAAGVTIEARVERDPADLVREVRVRGRVSGAAQWEAVSDAPLLVAASGDEVVEYYVEAMGPGGAVLAASGSAESPLRASGAGGGDDGALAVSDDDGDDDDEGGGGAWLWIAVGGALAVGAAVAAVLLIGGGGGDPNTQVEPFTVTF